MSKYDTDITTWSPEGRLFQMEYAMRAVEKGNAAVAARSKTHSVIAALKRTPQTELASYQEKVFKLDPNLGMAIAGLTSDARSLAYYMRTECMNHRYVFDEMIAINRLVENVAMKHQSNTMTPGRRPFGVGCLIIGYDKKPQLYRTCPSGNYYDFKAIAIGHRSQSARTYLERHFEKFEDMPLEDLVAHALEALSTTCADGVELKPENVTVAVVGKDTPFKVFNDNETTNWLALRATLAEKIKEAEEKEKAEANAQPEESAADSTPAPATE